LGKGSTSGLVRELFKYPMNVVNDQLEICVVCIGGERVSPPQKANDHKKHPVRSAAIEEIKREILWKLFVSRWPCLAGGRLDGEPPLRNSRAKLYCVDVVTA
jgi:hypothetical protein